MYEELNSIAQNNKIQILFKTQDEEEGLEVRERNEAHESEEELSEERKSIVNSQGTAEIRGRSSELQH
jgi:hypothetical protein